MGDGSTIQRHESITQELTDGAFIPVDFLSSHFKKAIQQGVHVLRTNAFGNGGGIGHVTEKDCYLFPLAFESTLGCQDLLGKVLWCIRVGRNRLGSR